MGNYTIELGLRFFEWLEEKRLMRLRNNIRKYQHKIWELEEQRKALQALKQDK